MHPQDILLVAEEPINRVREIAPPLLAWYERSARDLPWRKSGNAYHVWLSEIMLQQTRVEAARGYYARFLAALPDIHALAHAREDVLLKLWEGLGYYGRVRNLARAARVVLRHHGGSLPASYEALLALPGIGEYTAGAIASIAFGIAVPAVDANVLRVLSRLLCSRADISLPQVKKAAREILLDVIPAETPGDFNQALMELGATVCLPNGAPLCARCPLAHACAAHEAGMERELPVRAAKKERRKERRTIVLVVAENRALLWRREQGLLQNMFEPLNLDGHLSKAQIALALQELGAGSFGLSELGAAKHLFTHVEWRMQGYLARTDYFPAPEGASWAAPEALIHEFALPSAFRAYTQQLGRLLGKR